MNCPFCSGELKREKIRLVDTRNPEEQRRIRELVFGKGTLSPQMEAWYCQRCGKIIPDMLIRK